MSALGFTLRILALTTSLPFPPTNGLAMRNASIVNALDSLGHDLHLLALDKQASHQCHFQSCKSVTVIRHELPSASEQAGYFRRLRALPNSLPYGTVGCRSDQAEMAIRETCRQKAIDTILCETIDSYVNVPKDLHLPIIVDNHTVEHRIVARYLAHETNPAKRLYGWLEHKKLRNWERQVCCNADIVLACSDEDKSMLKKLCPRRPIFVIPNVIDTLTVAEEIDHEVQDLLLYMGGMDWYPNRDAVEFFAYSILPKLRQLAPSVRFVVAGRNPPADFQRRLESEAGIRFTGTVPDMRREIAKAAVCVVPLRIGSGTRFKILEAAAMSRAIVSTSVGAEGLGFVEDEEIIRADTPDFFAQAVADLLHDNARRKAMGQRARKRMQQDYSTEVLRRRLESALETIQFNVRSGDSRIQMAGALVER